MAFKFEGKEMYPIFFSQNVVGQFTPKWQGLARTCRANREKPLPYNLCILTSCVCSLHALLVQCPQYIVHFSTYGLARSNIRNIFNAEKAEKLIKIYRFYGAAEDN